MEVVQKIPEMKINGYPDIISYNSTKKIIEQMEKNICKITIGKKLGTGFFSKIPFLKKMLPVFITNNHIINEEILYKKNEKLSLIVEEENNPKKIELDENRMKYTNKEYDITIIEIKEKDEINNFLELDDKIMDDIINNVNKINKYINETVYIIQYPNGKLSVSYGIIEEIDTDKKYNFSHRCCTGRGSSGSPILTTDNKLIGIHKIGVEERNKISNVGTFLNYPIIDFNKQFASSENLLKEFI